MYLGNEVNDIPTRVVNHKIFHSYTCGVDDVNKENYDRDGMYLQLPVQPVFITTNVRTPFMARCTRYNIMWYVCQWLATDWRFPPGTSVFSINKPDHHDTITTINQPLNKINTTDYLSNCHTSGSFWWSCVPQSSNVFVVDYGLLLNITAF